MLNFGISLLVQYWSSVNASPLNKSIEVTLRMQVVLLNKSIGVRLLESRSESDFSAPVFLAYEETTETWGMSHRFVSLYRYS